MDKYHIYDKVGAGTYSQVFKGRRKKSIEYIAIKRVDKSKIDNVIQEIKVIHRLNSPNVVEFYDWHETRNYVCLILELCAGGDLRTVIEQDHREPESAVQRFGLGILAGLQHTHASGFLHGNLRPSNILIDEYGTLKLGGYGFSRSIADVDAAGAEGGKARFEWQTRENQNHKQCGEFSRAETRAIRDPTYMAPELLSEGEDALSFASDFWSLGCVLFELLTGEPPFRSSQSASVEERIMREDPPAMEQWECQGVRMSPQFRSLVRWLLQKDPLRRPTWPQLLAHPFWDNCQTPSLLKMPAQPRFDQAVLAARAAAEGTARQASPRGIGSNFPRPLAKAKHEEMKHATDNEGQRRLSDVRRGEYSPTGGERPARQAGQVDARERANRQMSRRDRGEMGRVAAGGMHEIERNDSPQRGLKEWRRAASTVGGLSPVGIIRGRARETRTEVERSAAVSPIPSPLGSGQGANVQMYESAQYPLSNDVRAWCNGDMVRGSSASSESLLDSGREGDSFVRSLTPPPLPPSVPVAAVFERGGLSDEVESGSIGERIAMGNDGGGTGGCIDADVASRAAAVRGLRLCRGTPPGKGGRISPAVPSPPSEGWSVGEQYGNEFQDETEGSRLAGDYSPSLSSALSSGSARWGSTSLSAAESRSRLYLPSSSSGSGEGSSGAQQGVLATALSVENSGGSPAPLSSVICNVHPPANIVASGSSSGVSDNAKANGATQSNRRETTQRGIPRGESRIEAAGENIGFPKDRAGENERVGERERPSPSRTRAKSNRGGLGSRKARDTLELMLHASDSKVNPIVEVKATISAYARQRGELLPAEVSVMADNALIDHLTAVYYDLTEASAHTWKKGRTLLYLQSLAGVPRLATILINSVFLAELLRLLRRPRPASIRETVATVIGQLVRHATVISPKGGKMNSRANEVEGDQTARGGGNSYAERRGAGGEGGGLVVSLIATIRERPFPGQAAQAAALRRNAMAALGELLFYIVNQKHRTAEGMSGVSDISGQSDGGDNPWAWSISTVAVRSVIEQCLGDNEREDVQNVAAKTVNNVLARAGPSHPLVSALVTPELALRLVDITRHADSKTLRGTAASGLARILEYDILGDKCHDDRERGRQWVHPGGWGWITSRLVPQPGVVAAIVQGLSEGSSPESRLAFLHIVNLLFWGAAVNRMSSDARRHSLWQAAQFVLESQQNLLSKLLEIVEHGKEAVLRAKGFLALRLILEFGSSKLLLDACYLRMLELLQDAISTLDSRMGSESSSRVGVRSGNGNGRASGLSPQEEYLYECINDFTDWLCTAPETTIRRLFAEIRKRCSSSIVVAGSQPGDRRKGEKQSSQSTDEAGNSSPAVAKSACTVMILLVNSRLLCPRVVTDAFLRDLSASLALSCHVDSGSSAESNQADLDGGVFRILQQTVMALVQHAEAALLPHRERVSLDLIPVLCMLLRSPSGDTRVLSVHFLRFLLPPLLRPFATSPRHVHDRCAALSNDPSSLKRTSPEEGVGGSPKRVSTAIESSLLPLVAELLSDQAPIPEYTVQLLLEVAREWDGLGPALLAKKDAIAALLDRLPAPLPPPSPPTPRAININDLPARGDRAQSVPQQLRKDCVTSAMIDPAVAALLTILIEKCNNVSRNDSDLLIAFLRYELPGRVSAAIASAVAAELPEVVESFFRLAVALLEIAPLNGKHGESSSRAPCGVYSRRPASAAGEGKNRKHNETWATLWETELMTLLAVVPTAVEGMRLFCVGGGGAAERRGKIFVDGGVRSGIADVITKFLEICHQIFRDRFLRSLARSPSGSAGNDHPPPLTPSSHASTAIICCNHVAEFLVSPDPDERPRLRILRILLAAASARERPLGLALKEGPLWSALLLLATGRAGAGRALRTHRGAASGMVGPTQALQALARHVMASIKADRVDLRGTALKTGRRCSIEGDAKYVGRSARGVYRISTGKEFQRKVPITRKAWANV